MKLLIFPTLIPFPFVTALTSAFPLHPASSSTPHTDPSTSSTPTTIPDPASGQVIDNILPNSDLPGGGIGFSPPNHPRSQARDYSPVSKRDETGDDVMMHNSATWYDEDAEREAEELTLVFDAANDNGQGVEGKGEVAVRRKVVSGDRRRGHGREWEE